MSVVEPESVAELVKQRILKQAAEFQVLAAGHNLTQQQAGPRQDLCFPQNSAAQISDSQIDRIGRRSGGVDFDKCQGCERGNVREYRACDVLLVFKKCPAKLGLPGGIVGSCGV